VTTIGILNIIFGSLGLCVALVSVSSSAFTNPLSRDLAAQWERELESAVPGYHVMHIVQLVVTSILSVGLLTSGILLLNMSSFGRILAIIWAILSIVSTVGFSVWQFAVVMPAVSDLVRAAPFGNFAAEGFKATMVFGMFAGFALSLAYPVVVLALLGRSSIGRALAGAGRDDYDDRGDYDRGRDYDRRRDYDRGRDYDRDDDRDRDRGYDRDRGRDDSYR
jgi:hypothetical protein